MVNRMRGRVERHLLDKRSRSPLHMALIDPEKTGPDDASRIVGILEESGTDAVLVGGSLGVDPSRTRELIERIHKSSSLPVIIFPGDLTNIVDNADAIFFMSLLNSDDPYYIFGAQVQGAVIVKRYGLEAIPTGYLIIGYGGAAGFIGRARPIPWDQPAIAASYAMAAEMLGMRFIYLEAGSGSPRPVPPEMISMVKKSVPRLFLIVGGGIRNPEDARAAVKAGADAVVTGTILEQDPARVKSILQSIKEG